ACILRLKRRIVKCRIERLKCWPVRIFHIGGPAVFRFPAACSGCETRSDCYLSNVGRAGRVSRSASGRICMTDETGGALSGARKTMAAAFSPAYRRYALAVLMLAYTANYVDRQILSILLQPIKLELGLSDTQLGFLSGITFALFYATLGIPIAMWADRGNRRNIITLALTIFSGMTVLCGMVTNFVQLAIARIGVGVGEAGSSPPAPSLISVLFPSPVRDRK